MNKTGIKREMKMKKITDLQIIQKQTMDSMLETVERAKMSKKEIFVVGCSTSEVCGAMIGTESNEVVAEKIMAGLRSVAEEQDVFLSIQCCEHLNRALVVERTCAEKYGLEIVSVVPRAKAGGALASQAMKQFHDPVVVETILAHAGMDIGNTMIGMHLKRVAIPIRLQANRIGEAAVSGAYTRPKLIGGERAYYGEKLIR